MANTKPHRIKTISEYHRHLGLPKPEHPLISVIDSGSVDSSALSDPVPETQNFILDFYFIALKRFSGAKIQYGQQPFDFDEGIIGFMAPKQVFNIVADPEKETNATGWMLFIHPDFLWNTSLAKTIKSYEYFDYAVNEALFLSDKEETIITGIIENIRHEYHANIDKFSQQIIISYIETLLNYSERFYRRQFITRKITNHKILDQMEEMLTNYFNDDLFEKGLPTVQEIANGLNVSPNYLSTLLKEMTGQSTQQHIHNKLIEKAKEKLSTTSRSISEIAYDLGFEHSQSFSKLFKNKTALTPSEFRQSFN